MYKTKRYLKKQPDILCAIACQTYGGSYGARSNSIIAMLKAPPCHMYEVFLRVFWCEINMDVLGVPADASSLFLSQVEHHCFRLAQALRSHARGLKTLHAKKLLGDSPYRFLCSISESSSDKEVEDIARKTATNVFQQYVADEKVRIPFHPGKVYLEMGIYTIQESQKASVRVLRPFENMKALSVVDEYSI